MGVRLRLPSSHDRVAKKGNPLITGCKSLVASRTAHVIRAFLDPTTTYANATVTAAILL
jgi:hypothetical protein